MKAVLMSIQPKWVEKIANGEKTIEVRKTKPKLKTPFKVYIYCTKNTPYNPVVDLHYKKGGKWLKFTTGRVIGEFVCDEITPLFNVATTSWNLLAGNVHEYAKGLVRMARLTEEEMHSYANGKNCYAWHITDLKIYDKPKELSEFYPIKPKRIEDWTDKDDCAYCKYHKWVGSMQEYVEKGKPMREKCTLGKPEPICEYTPPISRPSQSWCYVEELQE